MNRLINRTKDFVFAQQTSILSSTLILSGMIILSRIAGFFRFRILAGYYTKEELDVLFAAFRLPDLVFEILITGALSTTFIPFFIKFAQNEEEQSRVISSIINIISLILLGAVIILTLFLPYLIPILTPGFSPEKSRLVVYFSQILLLGQLPFLVLGNFLTGISQAKKSFLIPAIVPVLYNLSAIVSTVLFNQKLHLMAPLWGFVFGSIIFFVLQLPVLYFANFKYRLIINHVRETYQFFRTAVPRVFTVVVSQIDATIDLTLATLLGSGSYTVLYLAQRLQLLPVSIIGVAFGQASLPYLSEIYQKKKLPELQKIIEDSILNMLYLVVPVASFFIFARTPIVRLFFGGEKFDWEATVTTAITLSAFSCSLPFHSIYYFLTRCFYAVFDTKTPFYISLFSVSLNSILSIVMIVFLKWPVWSMAASFSLSITLNVSLLLIMLYKKIGGYNIRHLFWETTKIAVATFNASVIAYFMLRVFDGLIFDTTRTINVFLLLVFCGTVYLGLYMFLTWVFGIQEMYFITKMVLKVRGQKQKTTEVFQGVE
ncbi:murein biosynthesis integral membrane protein MurJ [Candidatus Roizmanbacteria bacterium RIFCSPLOWO2_01_FULL_41_22]|uniref:Probable lipid II flippase MurJ n=1 Tax=Candidatus Roizmanbacteria bacterium RIFCSPLOWO2_01_FULL_41_22 TaxID=1802067 RepID=A0A1F7J7M0_9BACT|nr:MAG: murein biosynthesis integral membrane protein MurJ [Candidatus Roizmanbacteria bacterium RIFCSPLOWO2_01_FULL_41_22]